MLDFNDTVGAVLLVGESQLTLRNLRLERLPPATAGYTSGSYVSMTSMLWPSVNAAPGCKVREQRSAGRGPAPFAATGSRSQRQSVRSHSTGLRLPPFGMLVNMLDVQLNMQFCYLCRVHILVCCVRIHTRGSGSL